MTVATAVVAIASVAVILTTDARPVRIALGVLNAALSLGVAYVVNRARQRPAP